MKRVFSLILSLAMIIALIVIPVGANAVTPSSRVTELLNSMTLRQKITQMLMPDFRYWDSNGDGTANSDTEMFTVMTDDVREIIEDYDFGAVIYFAQNLTGTEQSYYLTMEMQKAATKDGGIPMLIAADQEGGMVYRLGTGTALPGNMALGAATDPAYAKMAGEIIGRELAALGINTNLAPVVDVNNNPNNPVIGLRSYSDDATLVGELASATIAGLGESNVIGCAKHFPGHGDTATDSHYGLPSVDKSLSVLKECELKPYEIAIEQGIDMIMTAHILYPQLESDTAYSEKTGSYESLPATMSDDILTDLLKGDMGFEGIIITDAMNMTGITDYWNSVQACVLAIQAGVDMLCMPVSMRTSADLTTLESIISGIESAVNNGTIPMSRINDAVTRILTVKENRGILDWNEEDYSSAFASYMVGSELNRQAEREIAAAAVTVVQNNNNVLPLNVTSSTKVVVFVPYEDEKAQIAMAWNRAKEAGVVPSGASLEVLEYGTSLTSTDTSAISSANIVIVNSEVSAASKMNGATWASAVPMSIVSTAESAGKTTVVMSSDKPYDVQCYTNADAVLAVYGCKGSSVDPTEALTGSVTSSEAAYGPNIIAGMEVMLGVFGAQGKLPLDIPSYDGSTYTSTVLYEKGSGITYNAKHVHSLTLVEEREAIAQEGYNQSFYQCTGCGMWFEDSNGTTVIKDKFSLVDDILTDVELVVEKTSPFWLTHYNTLANEGAGTVISASGLSGGAWNDMYAFEPVLGTDAYKLVTISRGYTNGGGGVLPSVPKGGFVYSLNRGNDTYISDNCDSMIADAVNWQIGDMFVFNGLDLAGYTVPTSTSGTNWYSSSYVCTATYSKVTIKDPVTDCSDELQFTNAGLTITDDIAVNFKASETDLTEKAYTNPYVVFEMNGEETTVTDYTIVDGQYVFDLPNIAPHQMNDTITATLYATKDEEVCLGETIDYSIKEYCYNTLANYSDNEKLRTLIVDLLNYGAKSQEYMSYKTATYVNADLTSTQKAWGTASDRELSTVLDVNYATVDDPSVTWKSAGLNLKESVGMRFRFEADSLDGLTVKVTSGSDEWTLGSESFETNVYGNYVFFEGLSVAQMSDEVYVTAYKDGVAVSNTLKYSIESYAYAKLDSSDYVLVDLVKAMMRYGDSAKAYVTP